MGDAIGTRSEVGEVTGLATGHVMLVVGSGEFRPELKEANEGKDLPLGIIRDGIPKGRGVGLAGFIEQCLRRPPRASRGDTAAGVRRLERPGAA